MDKALLVVGGVVAAGIALLFFKGEQGARPGAGAQPVFRYRRPRDPSSLVFHDKTPVEQRVSVGTPVIDPRPLATDLAKQLVAGYESVGQERTFSELQRRFGFGYTDPGDGNGDSS